MTSRPTTARLKKAGYATIAGLGLFAGIAGIASAAKGTSTTPATVIPAAVTRAAVAPAAVAPAAVAPAAVTPAAVNPAALNPAALNPAAVNPAAGAPAENASEPAGDNGVNCENGIDTATGAQCDGGPAANQDNASSEAPDTETSDG